MDDAWQSHVLPHGPLRQLAPRLWEVTGSLPRGRMPRNMAVHRLRDGGLLLHSPVALDEPTLAAVTALGRPAVVVVPNGMHRLDAAVWKARFPEVRVLAPEAAREKAAAKVAVDGVCEEVLPGLGVQPHQPGGIRPGELCYEVDADDRGGKALLTTDLLFNLPNLGGLDGWLFRVLGSTGFFGMTGFGRLLMLKDKAAFRAWLLRMAELEGLVAVTVAHGDAVKGDVATRLRGAAARL